MTNTRVWDMFNCFLPLVRGYTPPSSTALFILYCMYSTCRIVYVAIRESSSDNSTIWIHIVTTTVFFIKAHRWHKHYFTSVYNVYNTNHFCLGGGISFSVGDCEYQRGKLFRILSQLRPRIRPLVPKCCTQRKVKKGVFYLWRRFVVLRESTTRIILAFGTNIWFFKTGPLLLVNLVRKVP